MNIAQLAGKVTDHIAQLERIVRLPLRAVERKNLVLMALGEKPASPIHVLPRDYELPVPPSLNPRDLEEEVPPEGVPQAVPCQLESVLEVQSFPYHKETRGSGPLTIVMYYVGTTPIHHARLLEAKDPESVRKALGLPSSAHVPTVENPLQEERIAFYRALRRHYEVEDIPKEFFYLDFVPEYVTETVHKRRGRTFSVISGLHIDGPQWDYLARQRRCVAIIDAHLVPKGLPSLHQDLTAFGREHFFTRSYFRLYVPPNEQAA